MPRFRKRIVRRTMGKEPRMMSKTLLDDNTANTVSIIKIMGPTQAVSATGVGDVFENADTKDLCSANSLVKYLNIRLESGIRDVAPEAPGFVEYAVIFFEKQESEPTVNSLITSNIGTQTLGDLCRNLYRGDCIWEGAFRVSRELPEVLDLKIKLPGKCIKTERGKYLMFLKAFRTNDVTDTTSDCRSWYSHNYKVYN